MAADFSSIVVLDKIPQFHDVLVASRAPCTADKLDAFTGAFVGTFGQTQGGEGLRQALHGCLLALRETLGPAEKQNSWLSSLRSVSGSSGGGGSSSVSSSDTAGLPSIGPIAAFCLGLVIFCDGTTEAKLGVGFAICGRNKQLDLHGLLSMLQASLVGAQALQAHCFVDVLPAGLPTCAAPLLRFEWKLIDELLRESVLARLVQHEAEGKAAWAASHNKWLSAKIFGASPKFSVEQLLVATRQEVMLLACERGDPWQTATAALAERQRSLQIDVALQVEQEAREQQMLTIDAPRKAAALLGLA